MCVVIIGVDWQNDTILIVAGECRTKSSPLLQLTAHEDVVCCIEDKEQTFQPQKSDRFESLSVFVPRQRMLYSLNTRKFPVVLENPFASFVVCAVQ